MLNSNLRKKYKRDLVMESLLKDILLKKGCSFEKYLTKVQYIKSKDDIREHIYLTPVITPAQKRLLFITREIRGNWFKTSRDVGDIISYISANYKYCAKEDIYIYHIYIENIKFEQFYIIESPDASKMKRLPVEKLDELLS